ncbi:polysaccharide lyase family 7 protein, partial [Streptomyces javensis]|nr:polysaccharide lyase family 7 protein [Streptomyces javensis]
MRCMRIIVLAGLTVAATTAALALPAQAGVPARHH